MEPHAGGGSSGTIRLAEKKKGGAKFSVYQNATLSAALTAQSLQPSRTIFFMFFLLSTVSVLLLFYITSREDDIIKSMPLEDMYREAFYFLIKIAKLLVSFILVGSAFGISKAIFSRISKNPSGFLAPSTSKEEPRLTNRQLELLGLKPKHESNASETAKKPPKAKTPVRGSDILFPIHQQTPSPHKKSHMDPTNPSFTPPSKPQNSPSNIYLAPLKSSPLNVDSRQSSPWSSIKGSNLQEISTEEQLEKFLAEVDEKLVKSAGKQASPFAPTTATPPANRTTPRRQVRMSPGSQKFMTPPKKGEGELSSPMSLEDSIEALKSINIYPQIEQWRDNMRQWFSSSLLKPLVQKLSSSHTRVMQTTRNLGLPIKLSKLGSGDIPKTQNEDALLHQIRASLLQAIENSMRSNLHHQIPPMQDCIDAIASHQRLGALMRGEWGKGLLPLSSFSEEHAVKRVEVLAEGTCVKNYEYEEVKKKGDFPTDSHLLVYLFCAFLEHPKWMLHVDQGGTQSSKNPLFLGSLPAKEQLPEKFIAVIGSVLPSTHGGGLVMVCSKHSPPIFGLYWDSELQFSLQGRSALWDAVLLFCHKIKFAYGGVVRGTHIGSSALSLLQVFESELLDS